MTDIDATLAAGEPTVGSATEPPAMQGRYVTLSELGRGSMGVVLLAYDKRLDRKVAIKLLRPGVRTDAMLDEAQSLARVSHPNVLTVYDADHFGEQAFIAMEFVRGQTLRAWQRTGTHSVEATIEQYRKVAAGLTAVHAAGLVHRDVKPENVMVSDDDRVLVMDFGVAEKTESNAGTALDPGETTESVPLVGTPAYMAPEEFEGLGSTPKSDQFSFCVALYEALTQTRPFEGDNVWELSLSVSQGRRTRRPTDHGVPASVLSILDRGLRVDPQARFPSMQALDAALEGSMRRWPLRLGVAVAALGGVVAAAALSQPPSPCEIERTKLEASWSPSVRSTLRNGFAASGHPDADDIATAYEARVDAFVDAWQAETASLCEGGRSAALVAPQRACLELQRTQLDTLNGALDETLDRPTAALALEAASSLPKPDWCTGGTRPEIDVAAKYAEALIPVEQALAAGAALSSLGKLDDAKAYAEDALRIAQESGLRRGSARAKATLSRIGQTHGQFSEAERWISEALRDAGAAQDDELLATLWISRIRLALESKRDIAAASAWLEASEVALARIGTPANYRAGLTNAQGQLMDARGQTEEARVLFREAVSLGKAEGHSASTVSSFLNNEAAMLAKLGRAAESRRLFLEAVSIATEELGPGSRTLVTYRNNAANASMQLREWKLALEEFREIERVLDGLGDTSSPTRARMHSGFSQAAYFDGQLAFARLHAQSALAIYDQHGLDSHPRTAAPLTTLVRVGLELQEFEDALRWADRLIALDAKLRPPGDPGAHTALILRAKALLGLDRAADALNMLQAARTGTERDGDDPQLAGLLVAESEVLDALGRRRDAIEKAEQGLALLLADDSDESAVAAGSTREWLQKLRGER